MTQDVLLHFFRVFNFSGFSQKKLLQDFKVDPARFSLGNHDVLIIEAVLWKASIHPFFEVEIGGVELVH